MTATRIRATQRMNFVCNPKAHHERAAAPRAATVTTGVSGCAVRLLRRGNGTAPRAGNNRPAWTVAKCGRGAAGYGAGHAGRGRRFTEGVRPGPRPAIR